MRTKVSSDNPYRHNRWGFAWGYVPEGTTAHLDFGCNKGTFLNSLTEKNIKKLVGVDVSEQAVKKGQQLFPKLDILKIRDAIPLPFDDATFESVTILDVLEHIYEQTQLLTELRQKAN